MDCVLVTGGAGWLGSHLIQALSQEGIKVVVYDNFSESRDREVIEDRAELVQGDILDFEHLTKTVRGYGINKMIHAAAIVGVPASLAQPALTTRVNVEGTVNVLEVMKNEGVRIGVHISSEETYGEFQYEPADEDHPLNPSSLYGYTKVWVEQLADYYFRRYKVNMVSARTSWLYGPSFHRFRPPQNFIENALAGKKTIVPRGGEHRIDYTYITDLTDGLILMLQKVHLPHRIYNIASGRSYTLYEMADIMKSLVPGAEFDIEPGLIHFTDDFPAPQKGALNISLAKQELGFSPQYDLLEGLRKNIEEMQS